MATVVTYDNGVVGETVGANPSFNVTIGSNPDTILVLGVFENLSATVIPFNATVGGISMSLLTTSPGPLSNFGNLSVWTLKNPPTGVQTINFDTNTDGTPRYYAAYSYYHVKNVDTSTIVQGTYSSSSVFASLTGTVNNTLMWAVAGGNDTGGRNVLGSTGTDNVKTTPLNIIAISAGDFGSLSTPTSETASMGANPGGGQAIVSLVSLEGPQAYSFSTVPGSYSLTGRNVIFSLAKLFTMPVTTGRYLLTGFPVLLARVPYFWNFVAKASGDIWTDVAKSIVPQQLSTTINPGNPIGLLLALTYATESSFSVGGWIDIPKSVTPSSWTDVPKATI